MGRPTFPPAATDWLAVEPVGAVLVVGAPSIPAARRLGRATASTLVTSSPAPCPGFRAVVAAAPSSLPFVPATFDQVVIADQLAELPPRLCLAEFARVLRPAGRLTVVHTARDDSVPWVRRLAGLLRRLAPDAMRAPGIDATRSALAGTPYFTGVQTRTFRLWVPMARDGLLGLVGGLPAVVAADPGDRQTLLDEVASLYDSSARVPEPLLLPYTLWCWRGVVDHTELTAPLQPADGLRISL